MTLKRHSGCVPTLLLNQNKTKETKLEKRCLTSGSNTGVGVTYFDGLKTGKYFTDDDFYVFGATFSFSNK